MIHDEAQKAGLAGQLVPADLAEHLRTCPECAEEVARLRSLESRIASARPPLAEPPPWEADLLRRLAGPARAATGLRFAGSGWAAVAASTLLAAAALAAWIALSPSRRGPALPAPRVSAESRAAALAEAGWEWAFLGKGEDSTAALLWTSESVSDHLPDAAPEEFAPYLTPFDPGGWDG
jgi:anti-sigma factor RsiW